MKYTQVEYNAKDLAIAESICSVTLSGAFITRHPLKRDMKQNPDTDPSCNYILAVWLVT